MLFIVVLALAAMITRGVTDCIHAVRGTEPPHLAKARMWADRHVGNRAGSANPVPGRGTVGDVWSAYWGGAMADIAEHRDRVRYEKKIGVRPPFTDRVKRFGRLLWEPVGEKPAADEPDERVATLGDLMGGQEPTLAPATPAPRPRPEPQTTPTPTPPEPVVAAAPASEPTTTVNTTEGSTTMANIAETLVATEVNNNEDARIALTAVASAAAEAAEALSVLEVAKAKLAAAANGTLEGMSGKRFDMAATASAAAAADAINVGDLAEWSEKFDTAEGEARQGLRALDKYLDSENLIAENRVDASTLEMN